MEEPNLKGNIFIAENFDVRIIKISDEEEIKGGSKEDSLLSSTEGIYTEGNTENRIDHIAVTKSPIEFEKKRNRSRRTEGYWNIDGELRKVYERGKNGKFQCTECKKEFNGRHASRHYNRKHIAVTKSPIEYEKKVTRRPEGYRTIDGEIRKVYKRTKNDTFQCAECEKEYKRQVCVRRHYTIEHTVSVTSPVENKKKDSINTEIIMRLDCTDSQSDESNSIDDKGKSSLIADNNFIEADDSSLKHLNKSPVQIKKKKGHLFHDGEMRKVYIRTKDGLFQCAECEELYKKNDSVRCHYIKEHTNIIYNCEHCPYISKVKSYLLDHLKHYHFDQKVNSIDSQSNLPDDNNSSQFMDEDPVHSIKGYKCMLCKKRLYNKFSYESHVNKPHVKHCAHCEKAFINSLQLRKHMRNSHEDMKAGGPIMFMKKGNGKFSCINCNQIFSRGSAVNRHYRKAHMDTVYNCNHCSYSTIDKYNLNTHSKLKHSGNGWSCENCQKSFGKASELEAHSIKAHYYHCGQCDRAFVHNFQLQLHIKIDHEGKEASHLCKICNKVYMHLDQHIEDSHKFETTYCQKCNAKFKTRQAQKSHKCKVNIRYY